MNTPAPDAAPPSSPPASPVQEVRAWESSPATEKVFMALAKAQGVIQTAVKDAANPHFKSTYADLDSIWQACRTPLSENGLSIIQLPSMELMGAQRVVKLRTLLGHDSGQWVASTILADVPNFTPQVVGSALTYLRRYGLAAMVGVAPGEADDDGNGAQPKTPIDKTPGGGTARADDGAELSLQGWRDRTRAEQKRMGIPDAMMKRLGEEYTGKRVSRDMMIPDCQKILECLKRDAEKIAAELALGDAGAGGVM